MNSMAMDNFLKNYLSEFCILGEALETEKFSAEGTNI